MDKKGFTLVEVMFASVIGVLITGMIMILYVGANNSMILGISLAEVNSDSRQVMDRMVRDIRWATQLETNRTISGINYVTGDDELIIKIPAINTSGDVIASKYDYVVYALDSSEATKMRKIIDPDAASNRSSLNQVIAENINLFSLSSGGTGLSGVGSLSSVTAVEIALTVSKQSLQNKTVTQTINSDVELRNN